MATILIVATIVWFDTRPVAGFIHRAIERLDDPAKREGVKLPLYYSFGQPRAIQSRISSIST
jgi:hypothetical protein